MCVCVCVHMYMPIYLLLFVFFTTGNFASQFPIYQFSVIRLISQKPNTIIYIHINI